MSTNLSRTQKYFVRCIDSLGKEMPEVRVMTGWELLKDLSKSNLHTTERVDGVETIIYPSGVIAFAVVPGSKDVATLLSDVTEAVKSTAVSGMVKLADFEDGMTKAIERLSGLVRIAQEHHVLSENDIKLLKTLPERKAVLMNRATDQLVGCTVISNVDTFRSWFIEHTNATKLVHVDSQFENLPGLYWFRIESPTPVVIDPNEMVETGPTTRAPWRNLLETVDGTTGDIVTEEDAMGMFDEEDRKILLQTQMMDKMGMSESQKNTYIMMKMLKASK